MLDISATYCKSGDFLPSLPFSSAPFVNGVLERDLALVSGGDVNAASMSECDNVFL